MIDDLLTERQRTHGPFKGNANCSQQIKTIMRVMPKWHYCSSAQREALDMIAGKISRILSGDPNFLDHWKDLAGYPSLIVRMLEAGNGQP